MLDGAGLGVSRTVCQEHSLQPVAALVLPLDGVVLGSTRGV